jgi:hypothetical protein
VVLRRHAVVALSLCALVLVACQSAYYETMKTLGKEKRDILVRRVAESKKDQEETKEKVKTTLESFQELTGYQGGNLEKSYKKLNSEYEAAQIPSRQTPRAHSIHRPGQQRSFQRVAVRNQRNEQCQAQIAKRRHASRFQTGSGRLHGRHAQNRNPAPVLKSFQDQVLFLKHNLNARAIGSLKGTSAKINSDVSALTKSIDTSIQEANKLISSLNSADSTL